MTEPASRTFEFGHAAVIESVVECWPGTGRVGRVELFGPCDGLEETTRFLGYFDEELPRRFDSMILVLGETVYLSDLGAGVPGRVARELATRGGDSIVVVPPGSSVAEVLRLMGFAFVRDEASALAGLVTRARARTSRRLDFGKTTVDESLVKGGTDGPRVGRVAIVGPFDGMEAGASGALHEYFSRTLPARFESVIVVVTRASYMNDMAFPLVARLQKALRGRGGNAVLAAPPAKIAIVLKMLGISFAPEEATALEELDSLG